MDEEIKVKRANVILRVSKEQAKEYLAKGFDILDSKGNVVEASVPNDVNTLKKAYIEHIAKIKALEAQLAEAKKSKTTTKKESSATAKATTRKSQD